MTVVFCNQVVQEGETSSIHEVLLATKVDHKTDSDHNEGC